MKILLASPRGFCAGVNRAISALHETLERYGTPVYVYHEIVHNRCVVEDFRARGVEFVDTLDLVPAGSHVLYSAHGVSPEIRARSATLGLKVVDATCPLVARIHEQAATLARAGFQIVLLGHPGHDEIVGVVSEAPDAIHVAASCEELDALEIDPDRPVAYLTQTTLSIAEAEVMIAELERRFPNIVAPRSECICFATQNRQRAVRELAPRADLVLIIGSATSSNSLRLCELARQEHVRAELIDGAEGLDFAWFAGVETVLISAGASAPEHLVQEVVAAIRARCPVADVETVEFCRESLRFQLPQI